ncbi:MAG TPA: matrixin family metalloprotease [Propionibacteriaceae bacterium]|nr:matrixin family metalloprotease [Propionibacteriaceae bacterium]
MYGSLAQVMVLAALAASSLFGAGGVATAQATTTFNAWAEPVIYVYDMTSHIDKKDGSPVWPVYKAAERWDNGNPVNYRYTTKGCPAESQCVIVKQAELASPTVGVTTIARVGTEIKAVTIVLDTTFGRTNTSAKRRNVTCHELGHALGLKHRSETTTCLTSAATSKKYPDATDVRYLNDMY